MVGARRTIPADRPAIGHGDRVVRTYGDFAGRVARLAAALRQRLRLAPGDRVVIAAKNSPDYLDVLYAIWHAGLVAVPANAKLHGAELGYILEHSRRAGLLRLARSRRRDRGARADDAGAPDHDRQPRL